MVYIIIVTFYLSLFYFQPKYFSTNIFLHALCRADTFYQHYVVLDEEMSQQKSKIIHVHKTGFLMSKLATNLKDNSKKLSFRWEACCLFLHWNPARIQM